MSEQVYDLSNNNKLAVQNSKKNGITSGINFSKNIFNIKINQYLNINTEFFNVIPYIKYLRKMKN